MKFYDFKWAPNARRVRVFLKEKSLTLPTEEVDLGKMQHKSDAFAAINPLQRVPALVLDDGTVITRRHPRRPAERTRRCVDREVELGVHDQCVVAGDRGPCAGRVPAEPRCGRSVVEPRPQVHLDVHEAADAHCRSDQLMARPSRAVACHDERVRQHHKLTNHHGIFITHIEPNTPASRSQLMEGDIIVSFNNKPVHNSNELFKALTTRDILSITDISVIRHTELLNFIIVPAEKKA